MERTGEAREVRDMADWAVRRWPRPVLFCAIVAAGASCSLLRAQQVLPESYEPQSPRLPGLEIRGDVGAPWSLSAWPVCDALGSLAQADAELAAGVRREEDRQVACVDFYYRAAMRAWRILERASSPVTMDLEYQSAWHIYHESLARIIPAASRLGRLDPRARLIVQDAWGRRAVPTAYYGLPWKPQDFCEVIPAAEGRNRDLRRYYRSPGLGESLVVVRHAVSEEPFSRTSRPFAVTAILRPAPCARSSSSATHSAASVCEPEAILEFYNPHLFGSVRLGAATVPLERDLSAPFAHVARENPRLNLQGFLNPGETDVQARLYMIEPCQRGKIPVVFIHGLLSDPTTWLDAVNDLRARPDLYLQYQFWYFRYPTGGALLESAAKLREQLLLARETCDPGRQDRAMDRMVLIGHSMGGLLAQLQVTYSYDVLWRHAARQPLPSVATAPEMRGRLERDFFFDPSPSVSRVVFIGTPHRGAGMARRLIGRLASSLARPFGSEEQNLYRELMDHNRDVFYEFLRQSPPTSIDLLEPDNPLLQAMAQMPVRRGVRLHSIIGTGGTALVGEPGDGIVPVSSARRGGVSSELLVPVRHTELHHDPRTIADLLRILREHAQPSDP